MVNRRFQRPSRPQRDYNAERRGVSRIGGSGAWKIAGRAFRSLGSTLAQSSHSHQDALKKEHGAYVGKGGPFTRGKGVLTVQQAKNQLRKMRFINPYERRALELKIEQLDPKKKWAPAHQAGISEDEFHKEVAPEFKKELGDKAGEKVARELASLYAGKRGKRIRAEELLEHLGRTKKYMRKEQMPIARELVKKVLPGREQHLTGHRGVTAKEIVKMAPEVHEDLREGVGSEFERAFGIVKEGAEEETTTDSKKVVGFFEGFGFGGGGRKNPAQENSGEKRQSAWKFASRRKREDQSQGDQDNMEEAA